jgi:cytochrome c oxidase subunit 3
MAQTVSALVGSVLPYRPPNSKQESTAYVGMVIFLCSWAMLFGALFFAYSFVRARSGVWPPPGVKAVDAALPALNTAVIALSSVVLQLAVRAVKRAQLRRLGFSLAAACALGVLFTALQWVMWTRLGLSPGEGGVYSSVIFGLCGFHVLHVLVGLVGLLSLSVRAFKGEFSATKFLPVRMWTLYWHFVGVIWALMFVSIFVL